MQVLLINTNYSWNKGSAAQVSSTVGVLKQYIPDLTFTLISEAYELDYPPCKASNIHIVGSPMGKIFSKKAYVRRLMVLSNEVLRSALWYALSKAKIKSDFLLSDEVLKEYKKSDLVLDLSGDTLSDHGANALYSIFHTLIGVFLKKKVAVYSQSIGPFRRLNEPLVRCCLNKVDLIAVREKESVAIIEKMHLTNSKIMLMPDVAFLLNPIRKQKVAEILAQEKYEKPSGILIGIGPNELMDKHFRAHEGTYVDLMAQVADYLIEKLDANILLISHVIIPDGYMSNDDRTIADRIYSKAKNKNRIKLLLADYSPEELKGIIGICDLFIGARMHSNIAALSMSVPTVVIGWSHKYSGIMNMLNQQDYFCSINALTYPKLVSMIDGAWANRAKIQRDLQARKPQIDESIIASVVEIKKLLG
jgi:colanic acid/amylovoran biosynthesis protein